MFGHRMNGFYEATVSTAVYTEPEQQDVVGLPDGAMLVTLTIENEFYSTMAIEDLDIYVGESTSEIASLAPGYFFDNPDKDRLFDPFYNAPDYVDFAYETGLFSWDWGFSDDEQRTLWLRGNRQPFGSWLGQRSIRQPRSSSRHGGVAVFETFIPDLETIPIPAPGALMVGVWAFCSAGEDEEPK